MKPLICFFLALILFSPARAQNASVRFVALGDTGAATSGQAAVADAIASVCAERGCDFAVLLGDNFYPSGVHSANDRQFDTKFETPYAALKFPFYVALGNHDNGEKASQNHYGDFQVAYAKGNRRKNDKWRMPARYYGFSAPAGATAPVLDLFALDSSPLAPYADDPDPKWNAETYGAKQLAWLQGALKNSQAAWKIAFAHHPYVSNGGHGNSGRYMSRRTTSRYASGKVWQRLIEKSVCPAGVDLMLQGHDHDLEWLKAVPTCGHTEFITSGAGGALPAPFFNNSNPIHWQESGHYGFFWFEVDAAQLTGVAYTLDDEGAPKAAFERVLER